MGFEVPSAVWGLIGGLLLLLFRKRKEGDTPAKIVGRVCVGAGLALGFTTQVNTWFPSMRQEFITAVLMGFGTEIVPIVVDALQQMREEVRKYIKAKGKAAHGIESKPAPLGGPEIPKEAQASIQLAIKREIEKHGQSIE